jgi:cyclopropane fatty-acyl-phospholipid synthase-like methyltransferase
VSEAHVPGEGFDFVLAIGILHHLGDAEAAQLFRTAHGCLRTGGQLITLDNVYVEGQSPVAKYLISKDRGRHVRQPDQYADRARPVFSQVDGFIRHDLLRVPYSHFIMKCQKT